jgi:hypothetical protein
MHPYRLVLSSARIESRTSKRPDEKVCVGPQEMCDSMTSIAIMGDVCVHRHSFKKSPLDLMTDQ